MSSSSRVVSSPARASDDELSAHGAAAYVGRSYGSLAALRHRGTGPRVHRYDGRRPLYRRADLDRWLAATDSALTPEIEAFARRAAAEAPPMTAAQAATVARIFRTATVARTLRGGAAS